MNRIPLRIAQSISLAAIFVKELTVSSVAVARSVLGARDTAASAIVAVPIELKTRTGVTILANCVSLTPGTTSLHVSDDISTLYVHVLDAPSQDEVIADIKTKFESRIKELEG